MEPTEPLSEVFKRLRREVGPLFSGAGGPEGAPPPPEAREPEAVAKLRLKVEQLQSALAEAQSKALETLARVQAREEAERQAQAMFDAARAQAKLEEAKRLERDLTARLQERIRELEGKILTDKRAEELEDRIARLETKREKSEETEPRLARLEEALRVGSRAFAELSAAVAEQRSKTDPRGFEAEASRLREAMTRLAEAVRLRSELAAARDQALVERLEELERRFQSFSASGLVAGPALEAVLNNLARRLGSSL
jgi:uncharacterized coiled-coil protein SlyX